MYPVRMCRTTFDQLLCDNKLQEKDNEIKWIGQCLRRPMGHAQDTCRPNMGHTRKVSKSDYLPLVDGVQG